MAPRTPQLLITCEHASNRLPAAFLDVARRAGAALQTHRGYDPGTLELGRLFARRFRAPIFVGKWSRLLIELNRSLQHPRLWSEFSRDLPAARRRALVEDYYLPHRDGVEETIRRLIGKGGRVLHVGVHSFTPNLDGHERNADVGLLYDPARRPEREFSRRWQAVLRERSNLRVRLNYPYRGVADGLTTHLRRRFNAREYQGIELEVNQRFVGTARWRDVQRVLADSLGACLTAGRG